MKKLYNFLKVKLCYRTYWKQWLAFLTMCFLVFACSSDDNSSDPAETPYTLRVSENCDRISFTQVQLPGYNIPMNGETNRVFTLDQGMPNGIADVKVTLYYDCTVNGVSTQRDVYVNFFEDQTTWINVESVITCSIQTSVTVY